MCLCGTHVRFQVDLCVVLQNARRLSVANCIIAFCANGESLANKLRCWKRNVIKSFVLLELMARHTHTAQLSGTSLGGIMHYDAFEMIMYLSLKRWVPLPGRTWVGVFYRRERVRV